MRSVRMCTDGRGCLASKPGRMHRSSHFNIRIIRNDIGQYQAGRGRRHEYLSCGILGVYPSRGQLGSWGMSIRPSAWTV